MSTRDCLFSLQMLKPGGRGTPGGKEQKPTDAQQKVRPTEVFNNCRGGKGGELQGVGGGKKNGDGACKEIATEA